MRVFALMGLLVLMLSSVVAQDDAALSDAPYIYYYSGALNGIVVERADGTDSRLIGQGLMKESALEVLGPGWSPDGRWFAWRSITPLELTHRTGRGYAVSVNDESLSLLNAFKCVHDMMWHPTRNILLVHGTVDESVECKREIPPIVTYWLLDADAQALLANISIESDLNYTLIPPIYWYSDDQELQFLELDRMFNGDSRRHWITIRFNGQVMMEPISSQELNERYGVYQQDVVNIAGIAPNPQLKYFRDNNRDYQFAIWWETEEQELPFDVPTNSGAAGRYVSWLEHPTSDWIFIGYEYCLAGCSYVAKRVSIVNPQLGINREIADCFTHTTCVGWLPDRVEVDRGIAGQSNSVLSSPLAYDSEQKEFFAGVHFSHILVCDPDERRQNLVQNLRTGIIEFVLPIGEACSLNSDDQATKYHDEIVFATSADQNYYAITDRSNYTSLYDSRSGERIATLNFTGNTLSFSDDSRYLITQGRAAAATWDIQELIANRPD